jgi:hypothetical protein
VAQGAHRASVYLVWGEATVYYPIVSCEITLHISSNK